MARKKADYDGLLVQEFLTKDVAMAYVNAKDEKWFDKWIQPWCTIYRNSSKSGDYYLPELRARKLQLAGAFPTER